MKKKSETASFLGAIKEELAPSDLPLFSETVMNVYGDRYIAIDGIAGVTEYLSDGVLLRLKKGGIKITGDRLEIKGLSDRGISITGKISSIEFSE